MGVPGSHLVKDPGLNTRPNCVFEVGYKKKDEVGDRAYINRDVFCNQYIPKGLPVESPERIGLLESKRDLDTLIKTFSTPRQQCELDKLSVELVSLSHRLLKERVNLSQHTIRY